MNATIKSITRKSTAQNEPHILANLSGLLGEDGFSSRSYPINLNMARKYFKFNIVKTDGISTIARESKKQIEKKIVKKTLPSFIAPVFTSPVSHFSIYFRS